MTVEDKSKKIIQPIQYARGIAALLVVLFHNEFTVHKYFGSYPTNGFFTGGHSGVEFFFILSGFIIYRSHWSDFSRPEQIVPFLLKRAIRVFPVFWLIVIPMGLMMLADTSLGADRQLDVPKFVMDLLLIPRDGTLVLNPAWTLQHEMIFYLVFGAFILNFRFGLVVFSAWQLTCLAALLFGLVPQNYLLLSNKFVGFFNFGFALGMIIAVLDNRLVLSDYRIAISSAFYMAIGLLLGMFYLEATRHEFAYPAVSTLVYFALYATVLLYLVAIPIRMPNVLASVLGALGNASYAMYVSHLLVASIVVKAVFALRLAPVMSALAVYVLTVLAAVASSLLIYRFFEEPVLAFLRRQLLDRRDAPPLAKARTD
jgi:exopolysaccharide production protein ExoZ